MLIQMQSQGPVKGIREDLTWRFLPLAEVSQKEQSEIHKTQAESDQINFGMGVLSNQEIADSRFGSREGFSLETTLKGP